MDTIQYNTMRGLVSPFRRQKATSGTARPRTPIARGAWTGGQNRAVKIQESIRGKERRVRGEGGKRGGS